MTAGAELDTGIADTADHDRAIDGMTGEPDDAEGSDPSEIDFADLMTQATAATSDSSGAQTRAALMRELALVDSMRDVAEASRYRADPRVRKIIEWIGANMCRDLSAPGATRPRWSDRRLLSPSIPSTPATYVRGVGRSTPSALSTPCRGGMAR